MPTEKEQQKYLYQVHAAHPLPQTGSDTGVDVMLDDAEEMPESDEYVFERIVRTRVKVTPVRVAAAPKRSRSHKKKRTESKMQVRSEIEYLLQWYGNCEWCHHEAEAPISNSRWLWCACQPGELAECPQLTLLLI